MADEMFYENKRFITIVIVVAVALAIFAMFSTTTVGQAWLGTIARSVLSP